MEIPKENPRNIQIPHTFKSETTLIHHSSKINIDTSSNSSPFSTLKRIERIKSFQLQFSSTPFPNLKKPTLIRKVWKYLKHIGRKKQEKEITICVAVSVPEFVSVNGFEILESDVIREKDRLDFIEVLDINDEKRNKETFDKLKISNGINPTLIEEVLFEDDIKLYERMPRNGYMFI